jgi:hypothetical protein
MDIVISWLIEEFQRARWEPAAKTTRCLRRVG